MDVVKDLVVAFYQMREREASKVEEIRVEFEEIELPCIRCQKSFKIKEWNQNSHWSTCKEVAKDLARNLKKFEKRMIQAQNKFSKAAQAKMQKDIVNAAKIKLATE